MIDAVIFCIRNDGTLDFYQPAKVIRIFEVTYTQSSQHRIAISRANFGFGILLFLS